MKILITNHSLRQRGGTQSVVIDLCRLLRKRGHDVMIFSARLGHISELLTDELFPVVSDLSRLPMRPDIIHGQHHMETMAALLALPDVPAICYIHGIVPLQERVAVHPRILRYINLSHNANKRVILEKNIPPERMSALPNFLRLEHFSPPKTAPVKLRSAVFCSRIPPRPWILEHLRRICEERGITFHQELDWVKGNVVDPLPIYDRHDLVFGTGRTALEALARGCAVSTTDGEMLGPLLTPDNVAARREINLSRAIWEEGLAASELAAQIDAYQPAAQTETTAFIRQHADAESAIDQLVALYEATVEEWKKHTPDPVLEAAAASDYLRALIPFVERGQRLERYQSENKHLRSLLSEQTKACQRSEKNLARLRSAWESFRSHGPFHRWFTRKLDRSIRNFLKSKK